MREGKCGKNTHDWITRCLSPGSRFLGKLERVAGPQDNGNKKSVARNMFMFHFSAGVAAPEPHQQ